MKFRVGLGLGRALGFIARLGAIIWVLAWLGIIASFHGSVGLWTTQAVCDGSMVGDGLSMARCTATFGVKQATLMWFGRPFSFDARAGVAKVSSGSAQIRAPSAQ